jgi:uncharacterized phiE125 gp8 family phage protein
MALFSLRPLGVMNGEAILPLADCRAHLRVGDDDSENDLIAVLRDAAIDMVERYINRPLSPRQHQWRGRFGSPHQMMPGLNPINSIETINYMNSAGVSVSVPATNARVAHYRMFAPAIGIDWPSDQADVSDPVTITFMAGYDPAGISGVAAPRGLIVAALMMAGHFYKNRESVVTGTIMEELPLGFEALCHPHRDPVV